MKEAIYGFFRGLVGMKFSNAKKIFSLIIISFFISFNYYVLKIAKDTLVVTASDSGAEIIPFIKLIVLSPSAILFTIIFYSLSVKYSPKTTFRIFISFFISYFTLFIFVLYPFRENIQLNYIADLLESVLPSGMRGLSAMVRHWHLSTFYVVCDMWTPIVLNLCFWGFTNAITSSEEASKLYPILRMGLNSSGIISGYIGVHIGSIPYNANFLFGLSAWDQALTKTILLVIASSCITLAIFNKISGNVPKFSHKKKRFTLKEQAQVLINSKGIRSLAIMIFSLGFVVNSVDVLWKSVARHAFPDPVSLSQYMHTTHIITGYIAVFVSLLMCSPTVRNMGWFVSAMVTPIVSLMTAGGFFITLFLPKTFSISLGSYNYTHIQLLLLFGMLQTALVRACKCSLFDISKDIALIMMSDHEKIVGKSAIDGIASKFGKSFASIMFTVLLTFMTSLEACSSLVTILVAVAISQWIKATNNLKKHLQPQLTK